METDLLTDVLAFCDKHNIAPSMFGKFALNDPAFVYKLRRGRKCWSETTEKARAYMASYGREAA